MAAAIPAHAQSTDSQVRLETIVVRGERGQETATSRVRGYVAKRSATGMKTDTPLIETPQSVSVVPRDQIDAQAAKGVGEALRYTAGVVPEWRGVGGANFGTGIGGILVRGYGVEGYWDGLKIPSIGTYGGPAPDLYLMERLDVLKGPSSVLFGQASPGGVVNLVSKRPTSTPFREVRIDTGSFGRTFGAFDLGGPIDADSHWLYRVTGLGVTGSTQVDHTKEGRIAIAPALTWQPTADTTLTVLASYQHDPEIGYYDVLPAIGSGFANPLGRIPRGFYAGEPGFDRFDRKYAALGYLFEHRFNDVVTVRSNLRYVDGSFDWKAVQLLSLAADNRTVNRYALRSQSEGDGLSADNQAELNFRTGMIGHRLLAGVDYTTSDADDRRWQGGAPPIDLFNPIYGGVPVLAANPATNNHQTARQLGIYAQDQVRIGNLIGLFGVRHDWADSTSTNRNTGVVTDRSDSATTGRAGLLYLFESGLAPYVSVSQSFQPITSGVDFYGNPYKPRTGLQYEAGVKYQPAGLNALLTLAVFDVREQNRTTPDLAHTCAAMGGAPGCGNFSVQVGEVHTRGFEAEAKAQLTPELTMLAAYTYLDARVSESNSGDVGKRLTNSPQHMASAWVDYTFRSGPLNGFGAGAGVRHMGAAPANMLTNANYFETPSSTVFDAALHYDLGAATPALKGLGLQLNVKNIADTDYVTSCGGNSIAAGYCFAGYRRTITASLRYRW